MALSSAEKAERRRLNAILADEDYGPRLVRLPKSEQRKILDLISANKGKEARAKIVSFSETRTLARRVKNAAVKSVRDNVPPAARNIEARVNGDRARYTSRARVALAQGESSQGEYVRVIGASGQEIVDNASAAARAREAYSVWFYRW